MPPPQPQPQLTHVSPPRLPQIIAHPNPNSKNRQTQQATNGETSYPAYAMEIQEVNLRLGRVLPDKDRPSPPVEVEEKEEGNTQIQQPLFPRRLIHSSQHIPKETELLGELKKLCVKIPLL